MTFITWLLFAAALNSPQAVERPQEMAKITIDQLKAFDSHSCTPARVEWIDAMIVTRAAEISSRITAADIENSIPYLSSYGCVNKTASAVVVIHSFNDGSPDDYLVIPKGWIVQINPFQFAPAEAAAPKPVTPGLELSQK